jgi:hypothetical protein
MKKPHLRKIFIHLPAYREPELIPTIKSALENAKYPKRLVFGICRQFNPEDGFDNVDEYRKDPRFKIMDIPHEQAKGLPYARYQINTMLENEEYICQLDSHHRFAQDWDVTLIEMHDQLKDKGVKKPILAAYLPYYNPFNDPAERTMEPWQQTFACFYPHGTIFIRPSLLHGWQNMTEPAPSRFLSGHFCFADNHWAKTVLHDQDIFFSGEELNLTVRSYTHGYDMFHPHKLVIWHATMREERSGMLVWDDQSKRGDDWWTQQNIARAKIRQLLRTEDNGFDLTGYDLGTERTLHDYEKYAGVDFKKRSVQKYTLDNQYPPNPKVDNWDESIMNSFYYLVNVEKYLFADNNYKFVLVAFDDENGESLNSQFIEDYRLLNFNNGHNIHYEEFFLTDKTPSRVVYWAYSEEKGWCERIEHKINQ